MAEEIKTLKTSELTCDINGSDICVSTCVTTDTFDEYKKLLEDKEMHITTNQKKLTKQLENYQGKDRFRSFIIMRVIVVATDEEYKLAQERFKDTTIIKTGVGYGNVYKSLRDLDISTPILNFGYAGSNNLEIGKEYIVSTSQNYHPNAEFIEDIYKLCNNGVKCLTSADFVLKTDITEPCLFDMELYAICSMGFKDVQSIKIVSDNLSLHQYEESIFNNTVT